MIMTRWHLDDPVGRFIERFPDAKILRYPAIAEEDEKNRRKGEALFPEHKSLSFLLERKKAMTQASWESEYQQNPIVVGGGIFPIEKLKQAQIAPGKTISPRHAAIGTRAELKAAALIPLACSCSSCATAATSLSMSCEGSGLHWNVRKRSSSGPSMIAQNLSQAPMRSASNKSLVVVGKKALRLRSAIWPGYKVFADRVTGSKRCVPSRLLHKCRVGTCI